MIKDSSFSDYRAFCYAIFQYKIDLESSLLTVLEFIAVDNFFCAIIITLYLFERNGHMISTICYDYLHDNIVRFDLCGLSSDPKPVPNFEKRIIANGSSFIEMDTGLLYLFDENSQKWLEFGVTV